MRAKGGGDRKTKKVRLLIENIEITMGVRGKSKTYKNYGKSRQKKRSSILG